MVRVEKYFPIRSLVSIKVNCDVIMVGFPQIMKKILPTLECKQEASSVVSGRTTWEPDFSHYRYSSLSHLENTSIPSSFINSNENICFNVVLFKYPGVE